MTTDATGRERPPDETVAELADEAKTENPDPTTARETFELEALVMEEGRSKEGESVELADESGERGS